MENNILDYENKKLRKNLHQFWREEQFSDLTLKTPDGKCFKVHKNVMCAASEYFKDKLNSDFPKMNEGLIELNVNVQSKDLKLVLEIIYTGKREFINQLKLSEAYSLYNTFIFLEVDDEKAVLCNHLIELIYHENCLTIWRLREIKPFDRLQSKIKEYLANNLLNFLQKNLPKLNIGEILDIVLNKDLNIHDNECVQIIKWVKLNFEDRQKYLTPIFQEIKFENLTREFFENHLLDDDSLYKKNPDLRKIITDAYSKLLKSSVPQSTYYYDLDKRQQRLLMTDKNFFEIHMTNKEIVMLHSFSGPKSYSATEFKDNIFISGGKKNGFVDRFTKKCKYFSKGKFNALPSMIASRNQHSSIYYNDKIYVCAGDYSRVKTEIFDINAIKWIPGPKMKSETWDSGLIQKDAVLYAFNAGSNPLIQSFDTRTDSWEMLYDASGLPQHKNIRTKTKAIIYKNKIYVFDASKCYIYNIENNYLKEIGQYSLNTMFMPFEVFEFKDSLWIFGKNYSTKKFECFNFNETMNEFSNDFDITSLNYDGRDLNIF